MTTTSGGNTRMVGYESYDPVLCLTISGKQEIRLKLKQSEQIFGPKVREPTILSPSVHPLTFPRWRS